MICLLQWVKYCQSGRHFRASATYSRIADIEPFGSVRINGVQKRKFNAIDLDNGVYVRRDYPDIELPRWVSDPLARQINIAQAFSRK